MKSLSREWKLESHEHMMQVATIQTGPEEITKLKDQKTWDNKSYKAYSVIILFVVDSIKYNIPYIGLNTLSATLFQRSVSLLFLWEKTDTS